MSTQTTEAAASGMIRETLERFVAGFNNPDLDSVMSFFAEDAVFAPGNGQEFRGKAAIRKAFEPMFAGGLGATTFDVNDWIVDEGARKATIRWVCRHDARGDKGGAMLLPLRWAVQAIFGGRAGWYGLDVFHFDEAGLIAGKYSYAHSWLPQLRRDLGRR